MNVLTPLEYRTIVSLAEVLVCHEDDPVDPQDVAANIDRYLNMTEGRHVWQFRFILMAIWIHPLVMELKAPLTELDRDQRLEYMKSQYYSSTILRPVSERRKLSSLVTMFNRLVREMARWNRLVIKGAQRIIHIGYYCDPRSFESIGYTQFSERSRYQELDISAGSVHPLEVHQPADLACTSMDSDVCIVGSGAGGAVLAYHLARLGREVLILEKGQYVEPREFTEDEVEMTCKLYEDGITKHSKRGEIAVIQGSCVGGSTVVNNGVCFEPPKSTLEEWNDPELHDAGLCIPELLGSVRKISDLVGVSRQDSTRLNPSSEKFLQGVRRLQLGGNDDIEVDVVRANLNDCYGCGYCNIGCAYGKKLSMLNTVLPAAQERFPGKVHIISECEVEQVYRESGTDDRVSHVQATLADGRNVHINLNDLVLSAGAIGSPCLLQKSNIGRDLPVGGKLSFNMGTAMVAEFDEKIDAYDGLQNSHYLIPARSHDWLMELWWNPPVWQASNMPGWFEEHYHNMKQYDRQMAIGVLVGTENNGSVGINLLNQPKIEFSPTTGDLNTLGEGLHQAGEILFAAGANRVMVNTDGYDEFQTPEELARLHRIVQDPAYMSLASGHPQGGCPISRNPNKGVVDDGFGVHGYTNLFVCDASVIPSSLTVNPQLTIMGLARYAASRIA